MLADSTLSCTCGRFCLSIRNANEDASRTQDGKPTGDYYIVYLGLSRVSNSLLSISGPKAVANSDRSGRSPALQRAGETVTWRALLGLLKGNSGKKTNIKNGRRSGLATFKEEYGEYRNCSKQCN